MNSFTRDTHLLPTSNIIRFLERHFPPTFLGFLGFHRPCIGTRMLFLNIFHWGITCHLLIGEKAFLRQQLQTTCNESAASRRI